MRFCVENMTAICECGNAKIRHRHCCDRCKFLDGNGFACTFAIEMLRMVGAMTIADMIAAPDAPAHRSVYRALASLVEQGRVRALTEEGEHGQQRKLYVLIDAQKAAA